MSRGHLIVDDEIRLPVRGRISVFGERDGNSRDTPAERAARAPYLAACLLGRPAATQPVTVLRAYAHPCVSARNLMLVDSNSERRTLDQLLRLQRWLRDKLDIRLEVEKPLFDILEEASGETGQVREPCIPDFILHAARVRPGGAATVAIETMGYADDIYRARKARTQCLMTRALGGSPVVQHDFHWPHGQTQEERDRRFWLTARWTITGPDTACPSPAQSVSAKTERERPAAGLSPSISQPGLNTRPVKPA
jgi:hypothetical protein